MNDKAEPLNRRAQLAFDLAHDTIVSDLPDLANELVRHYRVPLAYGERADEPPRRRFAAFRVVRYPKCAGIKDGEGTAYSLQYVGQKRNLCLLTTYEAPPSTALMARTAFRRLTIDGVETGQYRTVIRHPDGRRVAFVHYAAQAYDGSKTGVAMFAQVLGLSLRTAGDGAPSGQDAADRWIAASRKRMRAADSELIDALAATGRLPPGSSFSPSHVDPAVIANNAAALLFQLERGLADQQTVVATPDIAQALALLPEPAFRREGPAILAALGRVPAIDANLHGELLIRLADLGPAAIPVLARAKGARDLPLPVVIGACKIGPSAVPALGARLVDDWRRANRPVRKSHGGQGFASSRRYQQCVADGDLDGPPDDISFSPCWRRAVIWGHSDRVYFALKRLGLGKKADAVARHLRAERYARDFASLGVNAPASVCYANPGT